MSNITLQFLDGPNLTVQRAIASGYRHGIELIPGRDNPALGNCAFEAPIFNINDRSCFNEILPMSADYYRRLWIIDMENRLFESPFNPGILDRIGKPDGRNSKSQIYMKLIFLET